MKVEGISNCNQKRGAQFHQHRMIEPLMRTRPILIYSSTLRLPKPKRTPDWDCWSFQQHSKGQFCHHHTPFAKKQIHRLKHSNSICKTFLVFNYKNKYMPRAQAPLEVLLRKPQIPSICTDILSLLLRTFAAEQPLRVPNATEKEIGNRENLLYYSSNILSPSSLCQLSPHTFVSSSLLLSALSNLSSYFRLPFFFSFLLLAFPSSFHLPLSVVPFLLTDLAIIACRLP